MSKKLANRVSVGESFGGDVRYYYTTFTISSLPRRTVSYFPHENPTPEEVREQIGFAGMRLMLTALRLPVSLVKISPHEFTVVRQSPAVYWREIEPSVLDAMTKLFGEFEVVRPSMTMAFSLWVRRNLLRPLGLVNEG